MLEERIREWERQARREGRQEGLLLGTRKALLRLMTRRFGLVPRHVRAQINAISSLRELEEMADKVLTASSLQEMGFG